MSQEEKLVIERYLENTLTGIELKEFIDRLDSDDNFRKQVSFHNLLIEGIQEAEDRRLVSEIENYIGYRKPIVPLALKLIFTFLFITVGGIFLWYYIDPGITSEKHNYFSLDFLKGKKDNSVGLQIAEDKTSKNKKSIPKTVFAESDTIHNTADKTPVNSDSEIVNSVDESEIVVKKDQLLISYSLKPKDLNSQNGKDDNINSSIAKSTVDKLNPSAGLPETDSKKTMNYTVEFWVSPINYKGYKLFSDKLILFGIDEPQAVELYSKDEKLWMKYGGEYFSLEPSENFASFISVNEIPSVLR